MKKEIDYEVHQPEPEREVGTTGNVKKDEQKSSWVNWKIVAAIAIAAAITLAILIC